ncbi:MAG TPA: YkvA family protein [Candidatus Wunengus sp. YC61]|uniref:YkvA family protein n=1 Tax=Candidatus Wunengus sp. YC61 TaxID=3367698 RepID=UPI004026F9A3
MALLTELKQRVRHLKAETFALYLAARDPRTPWYAKLLVAGIVAYALSPIDLIPDFVPVLGYLDDLILIPIGIALAIKLVPHQVLAECRARARETIRNGKPVSRVAGAVIVVIWLVLAALCSVWAYGAFMGAFLGSPIRRLLSSEKDFPQQKIADFLHYQTKKFYCLRSIHHIDRTRIFSILVTDYKSAPVTHPDQGSC